MIDKNDKPAPPKPPNMRIGIRGETWDEQTQTRVPPADNFEYRFFAPRIFEPGYRILTVFAILTVGFVIGFLSKG